MAYNNAKTEWIEEFKQLLFSIRANRMKYNELAERYNDINIGDADDCGNGITGLELKAAAGDVVTWMNAVTLAMRTKWHKIIG
ncbi:hypothetical protein EG832_15070 [bacterium]|nr:hypothetical protein [bacterium]